MQRVLDRGPPPSVTLITPEVEQPQAQSEFQEAAAADDDFRWRFSGNTIPDDPKARDQARWHGRKHARGPLVWPRADRPIGWLPRIASG